MAVGDGAGSRPSSRTHESTPLVHCYAPDIFLHHGRLEEVAPHRLDHAPFTSADDDPWPHPHAPTVEREALRVANVRGFSGWRDPAWSPEPSVFTDASVRERLQTAAAAMREEGI